MSTTTYTRLDLINLVIFDDTLTNCTNLAATLPEVNLQGSVITNPFTLADPDITKQDICRGLFSFFFEVDHASPVAPIPTNAVITAVDVRMNTSDVDGSADLSMTFAAGFQQEGKVITSVSITASVQPTPMNTALGTNVDNSGSDSDSSAFATGALSKTSTVANPSKIIRSEYDFTTNPGGLYPAGYMTYADFIANFAAIIFTLRTQASQTAQWGFSVVHPTPATGISTGSCSLIATNFEMEVTWNVPTAWTVDTPTLVLPADEITISRPDPGVPPDQDTEAIEAIIVNGRTIRPNDPWIIYWLRFTIRFHLPADSDDSPILIEALIRGTTFTGSVPIGPVTVTYADLSGIYALDEDTHHDQLYARTTTSTTVTTQSVKIPAPFFVTSFFGSSEIDVQHYNGTRMRVTGQGSLKQIFQSLDYVNTEQLANTTLLTSNNNNPFTLANFIDQEASLRVYMETLDDYMNVSKVVIFSAPLFSGYPQ